MPATLTPEREHRRWDLFCRVIDNHGDLGVCWRLAADLAQRGARVRLWVDDASALAWMAPAGAPGVEVIAWREAFEPREPGDVVVEAFGCTLPDAQIAAMAQRAPAPVWINLEYLSAEPYVERSHGLRSPQSHGPGAGLDKWFFYPGFSANTGGLLREPALLAEREAFDRDAWWRACRWRASAPVGERAISLFCYDQPALGAWLSAWSDRPTRIFATHGSAQRQVQGLVQGLGVRRPMAGPALEFVPALPQPDYDRLLWACDLNVVRGEDSFVRAQWAGMPFVWHIYPQQDGAHLAKLDAFLDRFLDGAPAGLRAALRRCWHDWNAGRAPTGPEPDPSLWQDHCRRWRDALAIQLDLVTQLRRFASGKTLK